MSGGYGSLFERLDGESARRRKGWSQEKAVMDSVAAHLARMLSTRAGGVQTLPDYGLPDLNDQRLSLHDTQQQARIAIERFIAAYEPRLSQVRVLVLPRHGDPQRLAFAIEARLDVAGVQREVRFAASLEGSGQMKVE